MFSEATSSFTIRCTHIIPSMLSIWDTCQAHWLLLFPESSLPTHPDAADGEIYQDPK